VISMSCSYYHNIAIGIAWVIWLWNHYNWILVEPYSGKYNQNNYHSNGDDLQ
jgi:hypothetical protein